MHTALVLKSIFERFIITASVKGGKGDSAYLLRKLYGSTRS